MCIRDRAREGPDDEDPSARPKGRRCSDEEETSEGELPPRLQLTDAPRRASGARRDGRPRSDKRLRAPGRAGGNGHCSGGASGPPSRRTPATA
eukprot:4896985-Alexandrium_andersonii.AAC.1